MLRVEHRQVASGSYNAVRPECTELVHILSGRATVRRRADGPLQERLALPGTSWLVPAGTGEKLLELDGSTECLIIYLPAQLIEESALREYDVAPDRAGLVYEGGFVDHTLTQLSQAMHGLLLRPQQPVDPLFADGIRAAFGAHLVGNYNVANWRPASRQPTLEKRRLQRVLDYVEARLSENVSLDDLASEACLSPFHFSRLFRRATGLAPHRYLTERRIRHAQQMILAGQASLAEVALDTGFGSQANFSRVFRKATGVSPGAYRELHRPGRVVVTAAPNGKFGQ
jgi:AraC family transcriptional regulator